ncbi:MAG: sulfotransferase family 2 domain-containing protein [Thiomargarita sp.]|nr:sulfotransferase family 2 domain-containing protein [Thiomargarita sp.]
MQEKLIFLHIPKTAGTSLRHIIEQEYPDKKCLQLYNPPYRRKEIEKIRNEVDVAEVLYGHIPFGIHKHLGNKGKYIVFLRNPIARVISFYNHHARQPNMPFYEKIQKGMSLLDLIESNISKETNNHMTRIIASCGYSRILNDDSVLQQALENIKQYFFFVGLTENLAESVDFLGKELRWKHSYNIPYVNVDPSEKPHKIDEQTLTALKKYNRLDILLYEYIIKLKNSYYF